MRALLSVLVWSLLLLADFRCSAQSGGPPVHEPIDPYLATPSPDALHEIPVVIIRYLPTADGRTIDVAYDPDYYSLNPIPLSDLRRRIFVMDKQVKFMLEEGSRFRGYSNPPSVPSLGYRVVDYITVFEPTPRGKALYTLSGFPIYTADFIQILNRFDGRKYVEQMGVKEFWVWTVGADPSFPTYDPTIHKPENFRVPVESNMSSPTTGDISNSNRDNTDLPIYSKTYVVYMQNFRRTASEAVHNHGHQLEAILAYTAQKQDGNDDLFWGNFVGRNPDRRTFSVGRCGWTHMPPNTNRDYDYNNPTLVASDIADWTPGRTGVLNQVSRDTWTGIRHNWPDNRPPEQPDAWWFLYWMQSLPGRGNTIPYGLGVMRNWWGLTSQWDEANRANLGLYAIRSSYTISEAGQAIGAAGGTGSVRVVGTGGKWIATSNSPWIQILAGSPGSESGTVTFRVSGNLSVDPRSATLVIAEQRFTIEQQGRACTIIFVPDRIAIPATGGESRVDIVVAPDDCSWTAVRRVGWLALTSPAAGVGNGTLRFTIEPNPANMERVGLVTVGGRNLTLTQAAAPPRPAFTATGVVNGASFEPGICSSCWVTIQGANLSTTTRTWQPSDFRGDRLPTQLDGTSVSINGKPAYVYYVSPGQLNVLAPTDSVEGPVLVEVVTTQGGSAQVAAQKRRFAPAFFMLDPQGRRYVAAVHADGTLLGKPDLFQGARPARASDVILLFGTGFGLTDPAAPDGEIVRLPGRLISSVAIRIGNLVADVAFAGLVGAGLYQFNVTIPSLPDGDHTVLAEIGGFRSQSTAFITIQAQ